MYKCLLSTLLEQVSAKTSDQKFSSFDPKTYKAILNKIMYRNTVRVAIRESILSEICELTAKVEEKHAELTKKIQAYQQNLMALIEDQTLSYSLRQSVWTVGEPTLEKKQNEALTCERTLNKLYEYQSVLYEIRNQVLDDLHDQFMDDIERFLDRRESMWMLLTSISLTQKKDKELSKLKKMNKISTITKYRPLPKLQYKYTTR